MHKLAESCVTLLVLAVASSVIAQEKLDSVKPEAEERSREAATFAASEAKKYEIVVKTENGEAEQLVLQGQPLLRWSNPIRAEVYGSVLVWTRNDCPEALASIYCYFDRKQVNSELVSLSESSLRAERKSKLRWSSEPGVKFSPLADAAPPAETREKRQLQMRSLARKFSGALADREDDTKFEELRLMTRPLYQYAASDASGREGALFAFVTTNDPEILLLIESLPVGTEREWRYAAARLHFCRMTLKLADKTVWDVPQLAPPWEKLRGPEGTYLILQWGSMAEAEGN